VLRVYGKGEWVREIPIHSELRKALVALVRRASRLAASDCPALFLNHRHWRRAGELQDVGDVAYTSLIVEVIDDQRSRGAPFP